MIKKIIFVSLLLYFTLVFKPNPIYARTFSSCGQNITIENGVYREGLYINAKCGASNPLIIKARNDGKVVFDPNYQDTACMIENSSYVTVEGIVCLHSSGSVFNINPGSHHITVRRVSAYWSSNSDWNTHDFSLDRVSNVLLEDCIAGGRGRNQYLVYESDNVKLRRCFAQWQSSLNCATPDTAQQIGQFYATDDSILENFVGFIHPNRTTCQGNSNTAHIGGWDFWGARYNREAGHDSVDNCQIVNSVFELKNSDKLFYDLYHDNQRPFSEGLRSMNNNAIINTVLLGGNRDDSQTVYGNGSFNLFSNFGTNFTLNQLTVISRTNAGSHPPYAVNMAASGTLINSSFLDLQHSSTALGLGSNFPHRYNNIYNYAHLGESLNNTERQDNPNYDTSTYGSGAYLKVPAVLKGKGENRTDIGAEVLWQTENGQNTGRRLWPWPMEERICAETAKYVESERLGSNTTQGLSVTYQNNYQLQYDINGDGINETYTCGGGLWKTLNGVYDGAPSATTTPQPTNTPSATQNPTMTLTPPIGPSCNSLTMLKDRGGNSFTAVQPGETITQNNRIQFLCNLTNKSDSQTVKFRIYEPADLNNPKFNLVNLDDHQSLVSKIYTVPQAGLYYVQCAYCDSNWSNCAWEEIAVTTAPTTAASSTPPPTITPTSRATATPAAATATPQPTSTVRPTITPTHRPTATPTSGTSQPKRILFLHHSVGRLTYAYNLWDSRRDPYNSLVDSNCSDGGCDGLAKWIDDHSPHEIKEVEWPTQGNDPATYVNIWLGNSCSQAADKPGSESTRAEIGNVCSLDDLTEHFDLIIFKHCYTASGINASTMSQYQGHYQALGALFDNYPDKKFIAWTLFPKLSVSGPSYDRQFCEWLKNTWAPDHPNVYIFDVFEAMTYGNANFLYASYGWGDNHPNPAASRLLATGGTNAAGETVQGLGPLILEALR